MISELYDALSAALRKVKKVIPGGVAIRKLEDFLYEVEYGSIDYDYAREYFRSRTPEVEAPGACSAKRTGRFLLRHLDWRYDHEAVFAVHTPAADGRKAVIGTAGSLSALTVQAVDSGEPNEAYRILPFYLQDGINEDGLFAEMNVVPFSGVDRTVPTVEKTDSVCSIMLVRYILDKYSTVDEAIDDLMGYVEIFNPAALTEMGYELHLLLADATSTKVIEFAGGEIQVIETTQSTNFHLHGVEFERNGSVLTPVDAAEGHYPSSKGVETYGSGLERWNILNRCEMDVLVAVRELGKSVMFSKAYTDTYDPWYSEFVGQGDVDITVDTPSDSPDFGERLEKYRHLWEERSRDTSLVWITCHSCIYDLEKKEFHISVQEKDTEHVVGFGEVALIRHIDLWNQNVAFIEDEQPWPRPAAFIEFGEITWSPLTGPSRLLQGQCPVLIHIVTDWKGSTAVGTPTKAESVASMDLSENVSREVLGIRGESFHNIKLQGSATNHNHEDIVESIERYAVTVEREV